MNNLGVVAIGRNEGDRLIRCLDSLQKSLPASAAIVYVDSGSVDGSVAEAQARGVGVIELDMSIPFTGARARNAGFEYLMRRFPQTQYVQFIDGDCELLPGWVETATAALEASPELAIVFGRLQERFPEASLYNQLAELSWDGAIGEAEACGGIALMRTAPIQAVSGFNETMICGEEPEMCIRLRQKGWKIRRLDTDMAIHDIDMHRFSQWWKRSVRGGWAVAEGNAMYGTTPERYMRHENLSGWIWGIGMPLATVVLASISYSLVLLVLAVHLLLLGKIYLSRRRFGDTPKNSLLYAVFCVISKVPQAIGQAKYWINRAQQKPATLIEYKH
jgi:GT2 family glycosyltransferase